MNRKMRETNLNWLGPIPEEWQLRAVKNYYPHMTTGFTPPSKQDELYDIDGDVWVNISDLNGSFVSNSKKRINHKYATSKHKNELTPKGSLMYAFKLSVGQVAFAACDLYTNEAIASFHPDDGVYLDFLKYSSSLIVNNAEVNIYGAKLLNQKRIRDALIVFPPILEQQQIVSFLDRKCFAIDAIIEKTKESIEKLEEYKKAVITKAVTKGLVPVTKMKDSGIEWIGDVPATWEIKQLRKFYSRRINKNKGLHEKNLLSLSYGRIIRKSIDTKEGLLPESFDGYNIVESRDIVIRGTDLQNDHRSLRTGLVTERGIITSAYITLKPRAGVNSEYYHYLLHCYDIEKVFYSMGGGLRQSLDYWDFIRTYVLVPSEQEQKEIVNFINDKCTAINAIIVKKQEVISKLGEYKKSLIYYAVTGKIDCRNEATY